VSWRGLFLFASASRKTAKPQCWKTSAGWTKGAGFPVDILVVS
jgi:hypothetical protein